MCALCRAKCGSTWCVCRVCLLLSHERGRRRYRRRSRRSRRRRRGRRCRRHSPCWPVVRACSAERGRGALACFLNRHTATVGACGPIPRTIPRACIILYCLWYVLDGTLLFVALCSIVRRHTHGPGGTERAGGPVAGLCTHTPQRCTARDHHQSGGHQTHGRGAYSCDRTRLDAPQL